MRIEVTGRTGTGDLAAFRVSFMAVGKVNVAQHNGTRIGGKQLRSWCIHNCWLFIENLEDAIRRRRRALAHHDQHAKHLKWCLHHEQVQVEGQNGVVTKSSVDDHDSAKEQHQDEANLRKVLNQWRPLCSQVCVFDIRPLHPLGSI